jgi:hypothetical protein
VIVTNAGCGGAADVVVGSVPPVTGVVGTVAPPVPPGSVDVAADGAVAVCGAVAVAAGSVVVTDAAGGCAVVTSGAVVGVLAVSSLESPGDSTKKAITRTASAATTNPMRCPLFIAAG